MSRLDANYGPRLLHLALVPPTSTLPRRRHASSVVTSPAPLRASQQQISIMEVCPPWLGCPFRPSLARSLRLHVSFPDRLLPLLPYHHSMRTWPVGQLFYAPCPCWTPYLHDCSATDVNSHARNTACTLASVRNRLTAGNNPPLGRRH